MFDAEQKKNSQAEKLRQRTAGGELRGRSGKIPHHADRAR